MSDQETQDEGWWQAPNMNRYHYFRAGRSLCGRWVKWNNAPFEEESGVGAEPGPDDCKACFTRRKRESQP